MRTFSEQIPTSLTSFFRIIELGRLQKLESQMEKKQTCANLVDLREILAFENAVQILYNEYLFAK